MEQEDIDLVPVNVIRISRADLEDIDLRSPPSSPDPSSPASPPSPSPVLGQRGKLVFLFGCRDESK